MIVLKQIRCAGGATYLPPPNLQKGPLFATKWAKMEFYEEGLGPKSPLFDIKWAKNGAL